MEGVRYDDIVKAKAAQIMAALPRSHGTFSEEKAASVNARLSEREVNAGRDCTQFPHYVEPGTHSTIQLEDALSLKAWLERHINCGACGVRWCHSPDGRLYDCAGCKQVVYCGKKCQTDAWNGHKGKCAALSRELGGKNQ